MNILEFIWMISLIIQWNSFITNSVVNEYSVTTHKFLGQIGQLTKQINPVKQTPVVTNKNYRSEQFVISEFDYKYTKTFSI